MIVTTPHRSIRVLAVLPLIAVMAGAARAEEPPQTQQTSATPEPAPAPHVDEVNGLKLFEEERGKVEQDMSELSGKLEHLLEHDDVSAAEQLYHLERRAIHLLQYGESGGLASTGMTYEQTVGGIRAMLQRILRYQERVKDHAQTKLDKVLPGEPGRKLFHLEDKDHYGPLFRQGTPKPGEEQKSDEVRLEEMKQDFVDKGGDVKKDIKIFGFHYLRALKSGQLAEWTQIDDNRISITTRGAKHPVIGGGRKVRGAGSLKIYRDAEGEVVLAIVSNSSGNYKPGVASVEGLVNQLVDAGVREDRILTTSIVPEEPELVKLLLKARGDDKVKIATHVDALRAKTKPEIKSLQLGRLGLQQPSKLFYTSLMAQKKSQRMAFRANLKNGTAANQPRYKN